LCLEEKCRLKVARPLQFRLRCAPTKSVPPHAGSAGRCANLDPTSLLKTADVIFHNVKETTMTNAHYINEQMIEELRAELRNAPTKKERRQVEAELKAAIAERENLLPD
jgi:hypothetical protein